MPVNQMTLVKAFCTGGLLLAGSVLAVLIILEIVLALFWPHKITKHPYHEQYHPVMGWTNKPGITGPVILSGNASFYRTHNSSGLRMLRDVSYDKQPGIRRILLVGDSFFWGYGVDDQQVISELLQQKLGDRFEVINGAVTGYGTDQELLWLVEEGLKYQPDTVVLGFFPTNDIDEIATSVSYGYPKPYFSLQNGQLAVNNIPVPDTRETRRKGFEEPDSTFGRFKKFLRHSTHTYPFLAKRLNSIPALRELFLRFGIAEEYSRSLPGIVEYRLTPEKIQPLSEALILEIRKFSRMAGAEFLLVHIPKREQGPDLSEGAASGENPRQWNDRVSTYLADFAKRNGIAFVDLLPVIRSGEERGKALYVQTAYDHHWTPEGHAVAAEAVKGWVLQIPGKKVSPER